MGTHSSILSWRIPWIRGAWWATVHGVTKELDMTEWAQKNLIILLRMRPLSSWRLFNSLLTANSNFQTWIYCFLDLLQRTHPGISLHFSLQLDALLIEPHVFFYSFPVSRIILSNEFWEMICGGKLYILACLISTPSSQYTYHFYRLVEYKIIGSNTFFSFQIIWPFLSISHIVLTK